MSAPLNQPANMLLDDTEKPFDVKYYFFLIKKNIAIIATVCIVAVTITTIYAAKIPDEFVSAAKLLVERPQAAWRASQNRWQREQGPARSLSAEYYNTQRAIMLGPSVLSRVIDELKLQTYFESDDSEQLIYTVKRLLRTFRVKNSRIFVIKAITNDPEFSAKLANSVAQNYIKKNFEDTLYYNKNILTWLKEGSDGQEEITVTDPLGNVRTMKYEDLVNTLPAIQSDRTLRALVEEKNQLKSELEENLAVYRAKHPIIKKLQNNLDFHKTSIDAEKKRIIENLRAKAEGQLEVKQGRVIEPARVPFSPRGPDRIKMIGTAGLGALVACLIIIFLLDYFDDTIHTMEDLERKGILIPFLGPIPLLNVKISVSGPVQLIEDLDHHIRTSVEESFRYLRVAINFSAPPETLKLLAVSSCLPSEGKSFTSSNLAASLAADGNRTLLIDADLRRPVLHERFNLDNESGLSTYLTSKIESEAVIRRTTIENLELLTSGPVSPNPAEILGSDRMKAFLVDVSKTYDRVIVDCPPLTGIGDGFVVGSLIGHIVVVISARKTPCDLIRHTQGKLDKMGIKILGTVLNRVDIEKERYSGYAKYYYHTYNKYYKNTK